MLKRFVFVLQCTWINFRYGTFFWYGTVACHGNYRVMNSMCCHTFDCALNVVVVYLGRAISFAVS